MLELNFGYVILTLGFACLGMYFKVAIFSLIAGILFLFLGLTCGDMFVMLTLIFLGLGLVFNTFFDWRPER